MTNIFSICAFADEADKTIEKQVEALQANGISLLEIRGVNGKNISKISASEAREVKKLLDASGIKVWSVGSPAGKTDIHDDFSFEHDQFARLCEAAEILEAENIRIFSFYGTDESSACFDEVCHRLDRFREISMGCGAELCHENEKLIFGDTDKKCLRLLKSLPFLSAVYDPANFVQCGCDPIEAWNTLKDYVKYVHIKDADAEGKNIPAGYGVGKIPELLPEFSASGIKVLTLEPHLKAFSGLDKLEGTSEHRTDARFCFKNNREAFDFACRTLFGLIEKNNISEDKLW